MLFASREVYSGKNCQVLSNSQGRRLSAVLKTEGTFFPNTDRPTDYTECSCNHLTHFAVLFDFGSASAEVMMFVCSSGNMSDDVSLWPYLLKGGKISHFYERGCYATLKWK